MRAPNLAKSVDPTLSTLHELGPPVGPPSGPTLATRVGRRDPLYRSGQVVHLVSLPSVHDSWVTYGRSVVLRRFLEGKTTPTRWGLVFDPRPRSPSCLPTRPLVRGRDSDPSRGDRRGLCRVWPLGTGVLSSRQCSSSGTVFPGMVAGRNPPPVSIPLCVLGSYGRTPTGGTG